MRNRFAPPQPLIYLLAILLVLNYSCKKETKEDVKADDKTKTGFHQRDPGGGSSSFCRTELEPDWYDDSLYTPTILGYQLAGNPYSVANMQQASINLYGNNGNITANKKYVRFRPMSEEQTDILYDSELDLFDYPLDREVLEEGDYYLQPGMAPEDYPWLYTMVDMQYQPPGDIIYEVLQEVYIPNIDIWLENEAFRITGNPVEDSCGIVPNLPVLPCDINPCAPGCPIDGCDPGGGGGGGGSDIKKPAGVIEVWDSNFGFNVPVRRTRVVERRWFKIDPVYTNDQGRFQCNKRFKNKVNIFVKFVSNNLRISRLLGNPVSRTLYPTKRGIGIYSGNLSNISYVFQRGSDVKARSYRYWWAAQVMNAYLEYNEMAAASQIGQLPTGKLKVVLSSLSFISGSGATPMNAHRLVPTFPSSDYIQFFFVKPLAPIAGQLYNALMNGTLFRFIDMGIGFRTQFLWASNQVKDLLYHEMTHAAHLPKAGQTWFSDFVAAECFTLSAEHYWGPGAPYGFGFDGDISDIISVGESWAEHVAQVFSDMRYNSVTSFKAKQGILYPNGSPVFVLSSHLNAIEDFSPNRLNDNFRWIPEGIYYDMIDVRNEVFPVLDGVSNYTNQQLFQSLDPDVKSMPQYRARVLLENNNNQSAQVINLFIEYHY